MSGVIPSDDAFRRIQRTVRHFEKTYINTPKRGEKVVRAGRGGCKSRNEIWQITITGSPTGGTFDLDINILGVTETLTFNFDDTNTEVDTELETHANIADGDVTVTGGPFPDAVITIEFTGDLEKYRMPAPEIDFGSLTGGSGVGVVLARYQPGHPKDGSVAP
jgi:hypothetical protein